jgi:hypothetical protein
MSYGLAHEQSAQLSSKLLLWMCVVLSLLCERRQVFQEVNENGFEEHVQTQHNMYGG